MKLRRTTVGFVFWCPGCDEVHQIWTEGRGRANWDFDGNLENPTFSPSLLVTWKNWVCHSFIKAGQIQFLSDCTHHLAGQTVPIADWPYGPGEFGGILEDGN
jgi:Family of unknown function (DUF6527)